MLQAAVSQKINVFRKHEEYTSKTSGSEMPYTMFFTRDASDWFGARGSGPG